MNDTLWSYTIEELQHRVKVMNNTNLTFSNQYGMLFILNDNNEILLNITRLVPDHFATFSK